MYVVVFFAFGLATSAWAAILLSADGEDVDANAMTIIVLAWPFFLAGAILSSAWRIFTSWVRARDN